MAGALSSRNIETRKRPLFDGCKDVLDVAKQKSRLPSSDELQQILQIHNHDNDSDKAFLEMCSLRSRLRSQAVTFSNSSDMLSPFPEVLTSEVGGGCAALENTCIQQLLEIAKNSSSKKTTACLLSAEEKVKLNTVMHLLKIWRKNQPSHCHHAVNLLLKDDLPPELVMHLHNEDVVPLHVALDSILQSSEKCIGLTDKLLQLCCGKDAEVNLRRKILSAFCSLLIKKGFPDKKIDDSCLQKAAVKVMSGLVTGIIDSAVQEEELLLPFGMTEDAALVPHVCFKKFCTHALSVLVGHRPTMKVSEALKKQREWKSARVPAILKSIFKQVLIPFEASEVLQIFQRILEKQEVNWQMLLSCLATFLICFPNASAGIQELVSKLLSESLENNDIENTIVGFLLARQSCMEGAHVFPTYHQWFQDTFGDGSKTAAGTKKSFLFLMKFLTDVVPFEPAEILKVHILRPPYVPPKCRDILTDYIFLAKTRLADMKVPLEDASASIYGEPSGTSSSANPGQQDVEKALAAFASTGKVPATVMEASIFRKPYFVGKFLPALLRPRHLPDVADVRMKFIEALKSAGKIPSPLYAKYEEACKKETRQLLDGVFELDQEDDMEDMVLEPLEQLRHRLAQLTQVVASRHSQSKVAELVSIIADKIDSLFRTEDEKECSKSEVCFVDNCQSELERRHVQIVDEILNCVCRTVYASPEADGIWLQQMVRMLSQQNIICKAFFTRLLVLVQNKDMQLSEHHTDGLAALSFYLHLDQCMFPSVCLKTTQNQEKPLLMLVLSYLPCTTEQAMIYSYRFLVICLKTALIHDGKSKTRDRQDFMQLLPSNLLALFCHLSWRLLSETRPWNRVQVLDAGGQLEEVINAFDKQTEDLSERDYILASGRAVYTSAEFQHLLQDHEPSLEDWIDFELSIDPSQETLSPLQRGNYQFSMVSYFFTRASGKNSYTLSDCCFLLLKKIATVFSRFQKELSTYGRCTGHLCNLSDVSIHHHNSAQDLLSLLSKLVRNLPDEEDKKAMTGEQTVRPWLLEQLQRLTGPTADSAQTAVIPEAVLRILLFFPPYLLFTDSSLSPVSQDNVNLAVEFLEEFLVPCFAEGGIFSAEIISHLLQGYHVLARQQSQKDILKPFEDHPVIILSCLVHWSVLCSLFPSYSIHSILMNQLQPFMPVANRYLSDGTLGFAPRSPKESFILAAAVFSHLLLRKWKTSSSINLLLQVLKEKDCRGLSVLSELLLLYLSNPHVIHDNFSKHEGGPWQWLAEMWQQFPQLLKEAVANKSLTECSRRTPLGRESLRHLVVLRCMGRMDPHIISMDADTVTLGVHLCSSLCHIFEDGTCFEQHSIEAVDVREITNTVRQLVRTAPVDILRNLNVTELKGCGLEIFFLQQQRLKNGS